MQIRSSTPNKLYGQTEPEENKINRFKKPLTSMKFSLQKIQEIGSQINNILSKSKNQNSLILNTHNKKRSSIEISNSYFDGRGGTETERAHLYQKIQRDSINVNNNKQSDRNNNLKKYNFNEIIRNNSLNWANDKQINHCSLDYSKSENNTSRNKIKQQQNNQNGRAMILQQLMQDLDYFTIPSNAIHIQNDPNQTHLIICCQNYKLYSLNQYSKMTIYIGQHYRPITSMTKIIIQNNNKTFYSSSRDGQIIQWTSDSMHGIFKYQQSIRVEESPLQLHLDSKGTLYILTSNYLRYENKTIKLNGNVKCLSLAQNKILIAIDNQIHQIINNCQYITQIDKYIKTLLYEDQQLFILTNLGTIQIFNDNQDTLEFYQEILFDADQIFSINNNQIFRKSNEIIIQSNQRTRKFQMTDTITCMLSLSQQLLIGDCKKTIKIIKL